MPRVVILANPRTGSTYLRELLNSHPEIEITGELLNDEFGRIQNPLQMVTSTLDELHSTIVGFKVFPEQIYSHTLHFGELLTSIGATHVVVLWRDGLLETFTSLKIALQHNEWYSTKENRSLRQVNVNEAELKNYVAKMTSEWSRIGSEWLVDVRPIFVKFEDLILDPIHEARRVMAELSCCSDDVTFLFHSRRQNPASIEEKVTNFQELNVTLREAKLEVDKILLEKINVSLQIPKELLQFAPDREPCMPVGGWKYRVAEPYLPQRAKQNAMDAIHSGSISSAGFWPREMAMRLRGLYRFPVAQPCSHGFTALLLAMQVANIGEGDEVILPTMTMVAVPNAVHYLRAKPVFADNSSRDAYNPSWSEYEKEASSRTKCVVVTHTYGVPAMDIEEIAKQCKIRGWTLIEDVSECVGVTHLTSTGEEKLLGTFGDFAAASLYANKMVHGGDGGFVIARDAKIGKRLASIVNHGFTPSFHFIHFEQAPNAKMNGIGAAIATGCLDELQKIMEHRSKVAQWYRSKLKNLPIKLMPMCGPKDTPWVFGIQCENKEERTKLRAFFAQQGRIETRDFFFNLHLQPAYLPKDGPLKSLPNAEILGSSGFYLPTHSNLQESDVEYVCQILKMYYNKEVAGNLLNKSRDNGKSVIQIEPDGFNLQIRKYKETGELTNINSRGHVYIEAARLGSDAEEILLKERYDRVHMLLKRMNACLVDAEKQNDPLLEQLKNFFLPCLNYFQSQEPLIEQPPQRPWLQVDIGDEKIFKHSKKVVTTTCTETLQLLIWLLHQQKPETIWEIGSWMGHATLRIAEVCSHLQIPHRIFACDAFRWQPWMACYAEVESNEFHLRNGRTFLPLFENNVKPFADKIEVVMLPYDISKLPANLENQRPQFVFLDFTQEAKDLEQIWSFIEPNLRPEETIILFNGLTIASIPFFAKHADKLKPLAKPHTMAKAFRYVDAARVAPPKLLESYEDVQEMLRSSVPLKRELRFHTGPIWDHHHRNLFCKCVNMLEEKLHSDQASILFVAAVEQALCDEPDLFYENDWIGIIHAVANHPELFYTPDLTRLCYNQRYIVALRRCKGLFTLTSFQAKYLKDNWPEELRPIPIQSLIYPLEEVGASGSILPQLMKSGEVVDVIHIGSFARDFDFFFKLSLPLKFRKVLVVGDENSRKFAENAPADVTVMERLAGDEYEEKLKKSVVLLTLKYEGAANTIILECIARNIPIVSPNISSCVEYLGKDYPLFYDPKKPEEVGTILTLKNIEKAITYMEEMDKSRFSAAKFVKDVERGSVLVSIPPSPKPVETSFNSSASCNRRNFKHCQVTVCICSYKRTHHLPSLLNNLWEQDFEGSYQIIIWNNNEERSGIVRDCCWKYIEKSDERKSLEVISSTENYYCSIRFAMPALMKGDCLLICDDDIIPGPNFISFFYSAHQLHREDVLCLRGHEFLPHELNPEDPSEQWMSYDSVRFRDDDQPEQLIHFVHADACLIPKKALQEIGSVTITDPTFALVDDYWMSYVLNHKFGRNLRKLSVCGLAVSPVNRTEDSDTPGLALHTRPEVHDARLRLYVHHMLEGWPKWGPAASPSKNGILSLPKDFQDGIKEKKQSYWKDSELSPNIGFNINSGVLPEEIADLGKMGVQLVRIGAVGVGGNHYFELSDFLKEPKTQLQRLKKTIGLFKDEGIDVVLTLERRVASASIWKLIAEGLSIHENVIGYDLVNEPFTEHEKELHWCEVGNDEEDQGMELVLSNFKAMIYAIREVDPFTTIIVEPTFWAMVHGLEKFPIEELLQIESNLVVSFHFYEPMKLTSRNRNNGRYSFPSSVPWYLNVKDCQETFWDEKSVFETLKKAKDWADVKGVPAFVGEFGISRDITGAAEYLKAVIDSCKKLGMNGSVFSFRDSQWEAMDYELGHEFENCTKRTRIGNKLMETIMGGIQNK